MRPRYARNVQLQLAAACVLCALNVLAMPCDMPKMRDFLSKSEAEEAARRLEAMVRQAPPWAPMATACLQAAPAECTLLWLLCGCVWP